MGAAAAIADLGVEDLEALFDQVAAQSAAGREEAPAGPQKAAAARAADAEPADMFHRVGHLTRTLHDALHELGYDRKIETAVHGLPDARDRLNYIAKLTGEAAERALSAVERGQEIQKSMGERIAGLSASWEKLHAGQLPVEAFKALAAETRNFLAAAPKEVEETNAQFHAIMMAQDFHDLTGQVINRVVTLAQSLEGQLVKLLIETRTAEGRAGGEEWLGGPAMNSAERTDVVTNQAQVDDLLESLGF